ncbi:L,D-transpeptidase family protein [Lacticaseibacillus absianus]|uniref:L,D-transpeptidase family protein n=1 Tax=Lacticaseibacillus absianus TaxID=2729623 RepID=UPI0015CD9BCB|nr:L,D-transpeptidase family protein [Lacticaseibacillus absianus]
MTKKKRAAIIGLVAVAALAAGAYGLRGLHYRDRFLPDTSVLGVAVGGKTVAGANAAIKKHFDRVTYTLTEADQTVESVSGTKLGLDRDFHQPLAALLKKQNPWGFETVVLAGNAKADMLAVGDDTAITSYASSLAQRLNPQRTAPTDAKVVDRGDAYVIEKEKSGNQLDAKRLATAIQTAVAADQTQVDLTKAYVQPKLTADSAALKDAVAKLQKLGTLKATLTIQNHSVTIPTKTLHTWLSYTDGAVSVDQAAVKAYIQGINAQYGTYTKARQFKSTKRGTVTVPAGIYGWSIPSASESTKVTALIKAGEDFTHALAHVGSGYHEDGTDIGGTYIEVDKVNQHEWYYKNGQLVMDSAVVTGKPATPTPSGVFAIWAKQRNATLKGEDYATPVAYWMPINDTGVGLHDSPWQAQYGGTWYQAHGSHGCVNNPPAFIAKLFSVVDNGTPVIVF